MRPVSLCAKSELRPFLRDTLRRLRPDVDVQENLREVLPAALDLFEARKVVLTLKNSSTTQIFQWAVNSSPPQPVFGESMPDAREDKCWAMPDPIRSLSCSKTGSKRGYFALDRNGRRVPAAPAALDIQGLLSEPFQSLLITSLECGCEWTGQLFLLDAPCTTRSASRLRMLQQVVDEVGPVIYNFHLWQQASGRIRAAERQRLALDLHDGVVQSILATEVRLEILRRRSLQEGQPSLSSQTLLNAQNVLRTEVRKLRRQIEALRSGTYDGTFSSRLTEMVEAFRRETGVVVKFCCNVEEDSIPDQTLTEVLHMVEEALNNIRKHSGARRVDVRLESNENEWWIQVQDDGRGFDFSGRLSLSQLDAAKKGPKVIRERVHSANGELAIESYPNKGACLDIRLAVNS